MTRNASDFAIQRTIDLLSTKAAYFGRDLTCKFISKDFGRVFRVDPFSAAGRPVQEILGEGNFTNLANYLEKASQDIVALMVIPVQFRQLIYNLLSNSLKFCRNDVIPRITIAHKALPSAELPFAADRIQFHQISIADNGIGFDPEYQTKIFEFFQRLHTKKNSRAPEWVWQSAKKLLRITAEVLPQWDGPETALHLMCSYPKNQRSHHEN